MTSCLLVMRVPPHRPLAHPPIIRTIQRNKDKYIYMYILISLCRYIYIWNYCSGKREWHVLLYIEPNGMFFASQVPRPTLSSQSGNLTSFLHAFLAFHCPELQWYCWSTVFHVLSVVKRRKRPRNKLLDLTTDETWTTVDILLFLVSSSLKALPD